MAALGRNRNMPAGSFVTGWSQDSIVYCSSCHENSNAPASSSWTALSPDLVGPSITRNSGIIGEGVDMNLQHLGDLRPSTLLFHVTQRLLYTKWRDPGEEPKLHLFGQLKRITKQWLDTCLVCKGDTYPALLMYQELADMACERITRGIVSSHAGSNPITAMLDPYNPTAITNLKEMYEKRRDWERLVGIMTAEAELLSDPSEKLARYLEIARLAADTATKASISTPVRACTRARPSIKSREFSGSGVMSIVI